MTEREIREVIRELCEELDRGARRVIREGMRKVVMPSMLGAGLALSAGACSDKAVPAYGVPDGLVIAPHDAAYGVPFDRGIGETSDKKVTTPDQKVAMPDAAYGLPPPDQALKRDIGPVVPPYMAPDVGPPQVDYMAPDDGGAAPVYAAPMYSAPP
jgi:hypothetical protein